MIEFGVVELLTTAGFVVAAIVAGVVLGLLVGDRE